jgi:hypothetical protein
MAKSTRKTGKPKAVEQADLDAEVRATEPTMEDHIKELHGTIDTPQDGLPSMEWLKEQFQSKSAAIRYLVNQGHEVKAIAKHLGIRYQHARNVAKTELKRGPNEDWRKPLLEGTTIPNLKQFKPETD